MTEKNIFAYQLFLSDFNFFCVKIATPPPLKKEKSHPLFPSNPPLKDEVLSKPPFLKIWPEVQPSTPPPAERGEGGECTLCIIIIINIFISGSKMMT